MKQALDIVGTVAGALGALVCVAAGLAWLAGEYEIVELSVETAYEFGVGTMVFGCFVKLQILSPMRLGTSSSSGR